MPHILITGKDWTAPALLLAQLIEEGFDVEADEDVHAAVGRLWGSAEMPSILIVDLFESDLAVEDVATLSHWAKLLPVWVLAGHGTAGAGTLERWNAGALKGSSSDLSTWETCLRKSNKGSQSERQEAAFLKPLRTSRRQKGLSTKSIP